MAGQDKKAVVTAINEAGSFTGDDGKVFKYEVEFANGDSGLYFSPKTADKIDLLIVGKEAEYSIEEKFSNRGEPWSKITPKKPKPSAPAGGWKGGGGGGGGYRKTKEELAQEDKQIARQSSVKVALELVTLKVFKVSELLIVAEIIAEWVVGERPAALLEKEPKWTPPKPKPVAPPQPADTPPGDKAGTGMWPKREAAPPVEHSEGVQYSNPDELEQPEDDLPF